MSSRELRVLSVCRVLPMPSNPSLGAFVLRRLSALSRHANVRIVQPIPYFPGIRAMADWATEAHHVVEGISIEHAPMLYLPGLLKQLDGRWLARSVTNHLRTAGGSQSVDLIDAHFGYPDGVGCVHVARRLGVPSFVTVRGVETDWFDVPAVRPQLEESLRAATGCISVSYGLRDLLLNHGVEGSAIRVIPNAVDRQQFCPGDRSAARCSLGLSDSDPLVVAVGHLVSGKRHDVLIRALGQLVRKFPSVRLAIVGGIGYEPDQPRKLAALAAECGVAHAVSFVGAVTPNLVVNWLRAANAFALATAREGCCNSILEALAVGLPVVTTPVGDNTHYIKETINGRLVPVGDVDAMALALAETLKKQWDPVSISSSLDVGDWQQVASRVLSFFQERLASTPTNG